MSRKKRGKRGNKKLRRESVNEDEAAFSRNCEIFEQLVEAQHVAEIDGSLARELVTAKPGNLPVGWTSLHDAAEKGEIEAVTQLLEASPSMAIATTSAGLTPLHFAVFKGYEDVVRQLLAVAPEVVTFLGVGLMTSALTGGHRSMMKLMFNVEPLFAFVNNRDGNTLLHVILSEEIDFIQRVLECNPSALRTKNYKERTPIELAVDTQKFDVIELFQWHLTIDELTQALGEFNPHYFRTRYRTLLTELCEPLTNSLLRELVDLAFDYLGFGAQSVCETKTKENETEQHKLSFVSTLKRRA